MSGRRRRRALTFLFAALIAAGGAAAIADGYGARTATGYGPLQPVVVVETAIADGQRFGPSEVEAGLTLRRVPRRFVPPGALTAPEQALGLFARAPLPAGSYLLGAQLGTSRKGGARRSRLGGGRRPVEISVSGADALLAVGSPSRGAKVDVVVTGEPNGPGPGRTYVAAPGVPLLALRQAEEAAGVEGAAEATLGLTRREALRLLSAESFARKVTLLPEG